MDFVSIVVDLITDPIKQYVVLPIKRHVSYAFTCDSKVQKLHHDVELLDNKRVRLQQSVDEATRNGEHIYPNVTEWLTTAEKDIEEAKKLIQEKEEAKQKCCIGICPNLKTRYQLSKKADKKALVMDEQLQNTQGLDPVGFLPPPQPIVERSMYSREALPSRVLILNHIMDALKDQSLKTIGVYGMGGVGKTTLAKEVLGQAAEQKLFETVVLVAVSETPNLRRIQGEISDALGMKFRAEEVPGRASELHQRLNTAKVLIILDDVWQKLDFNAIGIPSEDASQGCKILLTSRKKDVLRTEMHTQKEFPLDVLEEEETLRLFEKSVSMGDDPEVHALANQVANKCAGLPLLILKVATDLQNKDSYAWKDMLAQLSSSENTEIYEKVHKVIESSYEKLIDEEAKSLFLLCALFGSCNIQIRDLLIYCMGLGLFKRMVSVEGSRNRLLTLISKLKNESLLLDGDMDGDMEGYVKIHDVVRDIAAAIASKEHCAFVAKAQIESTDLERKDFRRISLPYCEIPALPEVLHCPEAEVFSLFADDLSLDIPDSFFEGVTKLKVLHFSCMGFMSGLPSSICFLTGLQTLSLDGCSLNNVAMVSVLKQLEVLSFAGSNLEEFPREFKALTQLKLLDLSCCHDLTVIPSNVLSNLHLLEELYMLDSFDSWDTDRNASLVDLKNLSRLTTLEIKVPDDKLLPEDWFFNGIQNFKIFIGNWRLYEFDTRGASRMLILELETSFGLRDNSLKEFLGGTEVLYLRKMNGIKNLLCDSSKEKKNSFQRLRLLTIEHCHSLREVLPFSKCLPHLEEMEVKSCNNFEAIVGGGNEDVVMELAQLTSLKLMELPHLIGICRTASGTVSFPYLTSLDIYRCNSLKYVFTTSMVKSLKQLKELEISSCESMEEIILVAKFEGIEEVDNINIFEFPELDSVQLKDLPDLKRFSSGYPIQFPKLRQLKIERCFAMKNFVSKCKEVTVFLQLRELKLEGFREMKSFVSKDSVRNNSNETTNEYLFNELVTLPNMEIMCIDRMGNLRYMWHQQFADKDSFSKLKSLEIRSCEKLSVVFPSNTYRQFERFESLRVSDCNAFKEIYGYEDFSFENLSCDSSRVKKNSFQGLPFINIERCDSLRDVLPFSKCLPHLQGIEVKWCSNMEAFVGEGNEDELMELTQLTSLMLRYLQNFRVICRTSGKVSFPNLTSLNIYKCDSLKYVFTTSIMKSVPQLKVLDISWCESIETITGEGNEDEVMELTQLTSLTLWFLPNLRGIFRTSGKVSFPNLTKLKVVECKSLKYVFTTSMVKSLQRLEKLYIWNCDSMEEITLVSKSEGAVVFPELTELEIGNCSLLKNFVSEDSDRGNRNESRDEYFFNELVTLPTMELMCIHRMGKLRYLWHQQFADKDSFSKLKSLEIRRCEKLLAVFPSNTYRQFERLHTLHVSFCNAVKEIYEYDRVVYEETNVLQTLALQRVEIYSLPSLKHIWSKDIDAAFSFQNLQSVEVKFCPKLKYVIPTSIACGLLQLQQLEIEDSGVEMIIAEAKTEGSEGLSTRAFEWPKLGSLRIHDCDKLTRSGSTISKTKHIFPTRDSVYFIQKVIPNVEVLALDHHSLKAITESDDHEFPSQSWKLKELTLRNLEEESVPFLFNFLRGIYSAEKLVLKEGSFGEIFLSDDERAARDQQQQYHLTLKHLHLDDVSKLKHIVTEDSRLNSISQCFQTLGVKYCVDMMNITPPSSSVSFTNLTTLHIFWCDKMTSLVSASTAKSMIQLTDLKVEKCEMMEDIIVANENDDAITFNKLTHLTLDRLPCLNSFCSGNYNFDFPLLERVSIVGCDQMVIFCGGIVRTPKLQGEGNLNTIKACRIQERRSVDMPKDTTHPKPRIATS